MTGEFRIERVTDAYCQYNDNDKEQRGNNKQFQSGQLSFVPIT